MITLADELLGNIAIPLSPAGRVHVMPDEPENEIVPETKPLRTRVLDWCRFHPGYIDPEQASKEFAITRKAARDHLQVLCRRGFIEKSHKVKVEGGKSMQVYKVWFRVAGESAGECCHNKEKT